MAGLIVRCDNTCCVCGFVSIWGHHTSWPLNNLENDGNFEGYKSCDNPRYSPCLVAIQSYPPVLKHENYIYIYLCIYITYKWRFQWENRPFNLHNMIFPFKVSFIMGSSLETAAAGQDFAKCAIRGVPCTVVNP